MAGLSRREVLKGMAAVACGAAGGVLAHGYLWERHALELTRVDLPISGLAPSLEGLRVGFITDLHLSAFVSEADVAGAVQAINAEAPDLVALGGDYVSFADRSYIQPVAELIGRLTAPFGVFAIIGNHDDERQVPAALRARGIETLLDARTALSIRGESLTLAGLKFWTRGRDATDVISQRRVGPTLLLAHDPRRLVEAARADIEGVLAGHTHGGQVVLPGLGALAARKFPIAAGRLSRGRTEMFVSRGVGTVIVPLRINCPPEVALVTLKRA